MAAVGPVGAAIGLLVLIAAGCASAPRPDVGLSSSLRSWLVAPTEDFPFDLDSAARLELERAFGALVEEGQTEVARAAARSLLGRDPDLIPAQVLLSQAEFVAGECEPVVERLAPVLVELPGYRPGQLVLGACAERQGEVLTAYRALRGIADRDATAARNAERLADDAIAELGMRVERALDQGRIDQAVEGLALLADWRPDAVRTFELERRLATATGNTARELEILRRLPLDGTTDRALLERRAELEVEVGEARTGVEIFQSLSERYPDDPRLADRLDMATFRWRLERLPPVVSSLFHQPVLSRGDLAVLLYWTVPSLRSTSAGTATIATDILEHPQRDPIVRVLNLGVMEPADAALRSFSPDRPVTRRELLAAVLGVARLVGQPACLATAPRTLGAAGACQFAVRCGLIERVEECLPGTTVSGQEAVEAIRRTLALAGP